MNFKLRVFTALLFLVISSIMLDRSQIKNMSEVAENTIVTTAHPKESKNELKEEIVYTTSEDGYVEVSYQSIEEIQTINKIEAYLNSTLEGKGEFLVKYAQENNVDPYLAAAIITIETGCNNNCSRLVQVCNNVGGMKGSGCSGSAYAGFSTIEDGIIRFIDNLAKNYINKGLITPEQMNTKYAESTTWAEKVNSVMQKIKNIEI